MRPTMTPDEMREALVALGENQVGGAAVLGVDGRTMRRYLAGDREIPQPVARFVRYLMATGAKGTDVRRVLGDD